MRIGDAVEGIYSPLHLIALQYAEQGRWLLKNAAAAFRSEHTK